MKIELIGFSKHFLFPFVKQNLRELLQPTHPLLPTHPSLTSLPLHNQPTSSLQTHPSLPTHFSSVPNPSSHNQQKHTHHKM